MDYRLALMTGSKIPIPECQLTMHQPTIEEIGFLGESDFFVGVQTLTIYKSMFSQDESVLENISNFQLFMTIMTEKETVDKKRKVLDLFRLLFPDYSVLVTPRTLIFKENKGDISHNVDETNFDALQDICRLVFCSKDGPMDQQAFNPGNEKAKEIAEKLMRGRKRVAEIKGSNNVSIFSQYLSILSVGLHLHINDLKKMTMFQIYDLMERFSLWMNWNIDLKVRIAGGKPDSQPDNWMKSIH